MNGDNDTDRPQPVNGGLLDSSVSRKIGTRSDSKNE
jgi:hypothetical protein